MVALDSIPADSIPKSDVTARRQYIRGLAASVIDRINPTVDTDSFQRVLHPGGNAAAAAASDDEDDDDEDGDGPFCTCSGGNVVKDDDTILHTDLSCRYSLYNSV
jgi:hypothetical protein